MPQLWPELAAHIGDHVVIGHTVGFDLAVLKRECERAGIAWQHPRLLDTRLLAQVAKPDLAGYSLDQLASWLDVEVAGRHSAQGDAHDDRGRVPGPACRSCASAASARWPRPWRPAGALTEVLDEQHRAGWVEAVAGPRAATPSARSAASTAIPIGIASAT